MEIDSLVFSNVDNGLCISKEASSQTLRDQWETASKIMALTIASYLTDPICKVREYFYTFSILDKICTGTAQKVREAAFLSLGIVAFSLLTPLTAPLGAALRGAVASLESKPYIYLERTQEGRVLPEDREITLFSHNWCDMPAGYSITDGQVLPPSRRERVDANIAMIKESNADVVCLCEIEDIRDAFYISSQLSEYPFIIPVAGVRAIGPSSMMYVASKYKIAKDSIEFVPFAKGSEVTGRAQFAEKGVLQFAIESQGEKKAAIFLTHLQHSEIPAQPEEYEKEARAAEMRRIIGKIREKVELGAGVIFTGDFNLEEKELQTFLDQYQVDWLRRDPSVQGAPTWGGDAWCAKLMGKPSSGELVLDYTLVAGNVASLSTKIIDTGYLDSEFRVEATSDHRALVSAITIG
jgi:hypothetical protein